MPRKREISVSPLVRHATGELADDGGLQGPNSPLESYGRGAASPPPSSLIEALMIAPPHEALVRSQEEWLPLRDVIEDAIQAALTPRERWIFNACVVERKSIRALAAELGLAKSWVDRLHHRACRKLRDALQGHPLLAGVVRSDIIEDMENAA